MFRNEHRWNSIFFLAWHMVESTCDMAAGTAWDTVPIRELKWRWTWLYQTLPPTCPRSWLKLNFAGMLAVKLCDGSSCWWHMFSFVREVAQVVPAATSQIHWRHMRTRLSLVHKELESSLIYSAKKLICIGEKFVPQTACLLSELNKNTAELSFGSSRTFISKDSNVNRNLHNVFYCSILFLIRAKQEKRQRKKKSLQRYRALSDNCLENKMFVSKMISKTGVWSVKSAIRPDIVRWPAVIFSPADKSWYFAQSLS